MRICQKIWTHFWLNFMWSWSCFVVLGAELDWRLWSWNNQTSCDPRVLPWLFGTMECASLSFLAWPTNLEACISTFQGMF
jgi:hypothetical protein